VESATARERKGSDTSKAGLHFFWATCGTMRSQESPELGRLELWGWNPRWRYRGWPHQYRLHHLEMRACSLPIRIKPGASVGEQSSEHWPRGGIAGRRSWDLFTLCRRRVGREPEDRGGEDVFGRHAIWLHRIIGRRVIILTGTGRQSINHQQRKRDGQHPQPPLPVRRAAPPGAAEGLHIGKLRRAPACDEWTGGLAWGLPFLCHGRTQARSPAPHRWSPRVEHHTGTGGPTIAPFQPVSCPFNLS
jgi:hypothetical protein